MRFAYLQLLHAYDIHVVYISEFISVRDVEKSCNS